MAEMAAAAMIVIIIMSGPPPLSSPIFTWTVETPSVYSLKPLFVSDRTGS
jgi:hypothetical protein